MKILLKIILLICPLITFAQIDQLTEYASGNRIGENIHKYNDKLYRPYSDGAYNWYVAEIQEDSLIDIFEVPVDPCNFKAKTWLMYEDQILYIAGDELVGYNYLTEEQIFDVQIENGNGVYEIKQDILRSGDFNFDLITRTIIEIDVVFRGTDYYYYEEDGNLVRRMIDGSGDSEFVVEYNSEGVRANYYINANSSSDSVLIVDKNDVYHFFLQDGFNFGTYSTLLSNNIISLVSFVVPELRLYDLNTDAFIKALPVEYNINGEFILPTFLINNDERIYYSAGIQNDQGDESLFLNYYDLVLDTIVNLKEINSSDDFYLYFYNFNDSLISISDFISGDEYMYNINDGTYTLVPENSQYINVNYFTGEEGFFIPRNGHLFNYSFNSNTFDTVAVSENSNQGLIWPLKEYDEIILGSKNPAIEIFDESFAEGVLILNSTNYFSFNGNIYYMSIGEISGTYNFNVYKGETKEIDLLSTFENIETFRFRLLNNHIVLPKVLDSSYVAFNLILEETIEIDETIFGMLAYSNKFGRNVNGVYRFNTNDFNDFSLISSFGYPQKELLLNEEQILFKHDDVLWYYNGSEVINLESFSGSINQYETGIRSDGSSFFVSHYDEELENYITNIYDNEAQLLYSSDYSKLGYLAFEDDGRFVFFNKINDVITFTNINLNTGEIQLIETSLGLQFYRESFIGKYNNEYHFFNYTDQTIVVFNNELEEVDSFVVGNVNEKRYNSFKHDLYCSRKVPFHSNSELKYIDLDEMTTHNILGCEDGYAVKSFVFKDSTIYFTAANNEEGTQLYSYVFEDFIIKTEDTFDEDELILSPNPVNNTLYLNIMVADLIIYSVDGVQVQQESNCSTVDVQRLGEGIYFMKYLIGSEYKTMKFVKVE